ncbi:MAG: T9SS type A sorting domain-containing protein [Bacteroidota bacterium]
MKPFFTLLLLPFAFCIQAHSQTHVVPVSYTTTGSFLGPLANTQRTYQLLINANQLTPLVGQTLKGITFGRLASATVAWPDSDVTYTNYDIYLSESVAPAQRSLTFANNIVGTQTRVRSGALTITAGSFPPDPAPNNFGAVIGFTDGYAYNGGHLLVEIRHTGFTGTSVSVEAITTSGTGYGTNFSACWVGNYSGTSTTTQGNFAITRFTHDAGLPLTLSSFKAVRRSEDASLEWTTASEQNTQQFSVERSTDSRVFSSIGTVAAAGNSNSAINYQFTDRNITSLGVKLLYYRLKMVDKDGLYKYSPIATVNISKTGAVITLYPNPVKDIATLSVNAEKQETVQYTIIAANGKQVQTGRYLFTQGNNLFNVNVAQLPAGNYYLRLEGTNTSERIGFMKQ